MIKKLIFLLLGLIFLIPEMKGEEERTDSIEFQAPPERKPGKLMLKSDVVPWSVVIPNLGAEYTFADKWSAALDVAFCPWKISNKFSLKTVAILPEGRYWLKDNTKGSYFNFHLNIAWYNVRYHRYRYQDTNGPLLGAGVGYGYRLNIDKRWGVEFSVGAGFFSTRYHRYHNVANGALADTRNSTYWGIDRLGISFTYNLADL